MFEEYDKKTLKSFMGQYRKGSAEDVPADHFVDSRNLSLQPGRFGIRPGSSLRYDLGLPVTDIAEWVNVQDVLPHDIVSIDANGNIRRNNVSTPLWTAPGATDFFTINLFGRLFICPVGPNGPVGNMLMLYDSPVVALGLHTLREAGGDPPVQAAQMSAANGAGSTGSFNSGAINPKSANQSGSANPWSNPTNAEKHDGQYATVTLFASGGSNASNLLLVNNFGFNIPANAVIVGVVATIEHNQFSGTSAVEDSIIQLAGTSSTQNKNNLNPWSVNFEETFTYGANNDTWGTTISPSDVNSPNFGLAITINCTLLPGNGGTAGIDSVTITVYYTVHTVGNVPAGVYGINIVYETDTGFLTPPATSPSVAIQFTASGGHTLVLTNIPIGPNYVVARQVIITQAGQTAFYFVPISDGGFINDNTTTTATIDFFETDLIASADYLFNVRARIPSAREINFYSGRVVLGGFAPPNNALLRLSYSGQPETFDQTQESIIVSKDDGYNVTNTLVLRGSLYIWKQLGIFITADNGDIPPNWEVDDVDLSVGTGYKGLSTVSPTVEHATKADVSVFADISGAYLFNGVVQNPELSWKIQDLWDTITDVSNISIVVDSKYKRIIFNGFDSASALYQLALVADYTEGIDAQNIKWDIWTYHIDEHMLDTIDGKRVEIVTLLPSGKIIRHDPNQFVDYVDGVNTSAIDHYAILGGNNIDEGSLNIFGGMLVKASGYGVMYPSVAGEEDQTSATPTFRIALKPQTLVSRPRHDIAIKSKFISERWYVKFESQPNLPGGDLPPKGAYFFISRITLFGSPIYAERPANAVPVNNP